MDDASSEGSIWWPEGRKPTAEGQRWACSTCWNHCKPELYGGLWEGRLLKETSLLIWKSRAGGLPGLVPCHKRSSRRESNHDQTSRRTCRTRGVNEVRRRVRRGGRRWRRPGWRTRHVARGNPAAAGRRRVCRLSRLGNSTLGRFPRPSAYGTPSTCSEFRVKRACAWVGRGARWKRSFGRKPLRVRRRS